MFKRKKTIRMGHGTFGLKRGFQRSGGLIKIAVDERGMDGRGIQGLHLSRRTKAKKP
jgi:hypothetical protein